jgi:DNA-binding CsgD family transcriptional regulator
MDRDDGMEYRGPETQARVSDDAFRKLVAEGNTANQIAKITGYRQQYTLTRLRDLRLKAKPCPRVSDETLRQLADSTKAVDEIVEASDGNYSVIARRIGTLGLKTKKVDRSVSPESRKLNAKIARLLSEGHSPKEIGKMVGLSRQRVMARHDWYRRNMES